MFSFFKNPFLNEMQRNIEIQNKGPRSFLDENGNPVGNVPGEGYEYRYQYQQQPYSIPKTIQPGFQFGQAPVNNQVTPTPQQPVNIDDFEVIGSDTPPPIEGLNMSIGKTMQLFNQPGEQMPTDKFRTNAVGTINPTEIAEQKMTGNALRTNQIAPINLNTPITMPETGPMPGYTLPQPKPTETIQEGNAEEVAKANNFTPEQYYAFKGLLDSGALLNNMIQEPPPAVSWKLPQLQRIRLDRTPFEQQRTDIERMGRVSYRGLREGISQSSDLMKGLAAVTSGTQEAMGQVGTAEAQAELAVEQQNQQIQAQENAMQTEMLNQEQMANYQIQQQAQQWKDQMISNQLGRIGDTAGAYANYLYNREQAEKATQLSKEQANLANDIQLKWMDYELSLRELNSDAYQEAENEAVVKHIQENQTKLLNDERFANLKTAYGDKVDYTKYNDHMAELSYFENLRKNAEANPMYNQKPVKGQGEGVSPDETDEVFNQRLDRYNKLMQQHGQITEWLDEKKPLYDLEKQYFDEIRNNFSTSQARQDFQSEYLKSRGLISTEEYAESLRSLVESARQE